MRLGVENEDLLFLKIQILLSHGVDKMEMETQLVFSKVSISLLDINVKGSGFFL